MVSSILNVGDKLDIRILQQVENASKTGEKPKVWRSVIYDIKNNGELELGMPTEGGKIVLLSLGIRYDLVFYARGGLYQCIGQVKERYKSDNIYMVSMELKTNLSKFQRREYYRKECLLDVFYHELTEGEAGSEAAETLFIRRAELFPDERMKKGIAVDISGGGLRMVVDEPVDTGNLLLNFTLKNDFGERDIWLYGTVLQIRKLDGNGLVRYECRVMYDIHDNRVREQIIKYIFEEERKSRKK